MRTYSHTLLTWAATRYAKPSDPATAAWAALGAALPDLPAGLGVAWLWARRRTYSREEFDADVCGRALFRRPDAALHSALPMAAALLLFGPWGTETPRKALPALLLGWAGHVAADALTHSTDARPVLWPVSGWRFESPVSYRERGRHGRAFAVAEHAIALFILARLLGRERPGAQAPPRFRGGSSLRRGRSAKPAG